MEEAERVALEAMRAQERNLRGGAGGTAASPLTAAPEEGTRRKKKRRVGVFPSASRAAAARVAAEARGEAARLISALGADPELANGLVRRLGKSPRVADLAAAAEE